MKCFIALKIPGNISLEIKKIQENLLKFYGKKTELENLHLTLKFLGEIDEDKVEEVKERLKEIKFNKHQTNLDYLGFFDNQKKGVVWIHLPKCEKLQKVIDNKMHGLDFDLERRFMGHLTIVRVKNLKNKKEFLKGLKEIKISKISFNVDKFYLMSSKTFKEGPIYNILGEYNLD